MAGRAAVAFKESHMDEFQALEKISNGVVREDLSYPANMWTMP